MDIRRFIFKNRSFTPIPIVLIVIHFSSPAVPYFHIGLLLVLIGEVIRLHAVRYAGGATRTTTVGAPALCTAGPYARTRNPLYLGNIVIYIGHIIRTLMKGLNVTGNQLTIPNKLYFIRLLTL